MTRARHAQKAVRYGAPCFALLRQNSRYLCINGKNRWKTLPIGRRRSRNPLRTLANRDRATSVFGTPVALKGSHRETRGGFYGLAKRIRIEQGKRRNLWRRHSSSYKLELAQRDMATAKKARAPRGPRAPERRKSLADKARCVGALKLL
jgi:hypothetical protein